MRRRIASKSSAARAPRGRGARGGRGRLLRAGRPRHRHRRRRRRRGHPRHAGGHQGPTRDRHLPLPDRRLRRHRQGRREGLRALGQPGQQVGRHPRPPSPAQDRRRHHECHPGGHQLRVPDQRGPRRPGLRPGLLAADRPGGARRGALRLRVHRAGRGSADRVRAPPAQPVPRPAGPGARPWRLLRRLHLVPPAKPAAEDRRLLQRRQPVRLPGGGSGQAEAPGGRHQDRARPDLPGGAGRPRPGRRPGRRRQARPGGRRHPGRGRLRDHQGLRAAEVQPEDPVHAQRRLRPGELPRPGRHGQRRRHLHRRRLVADGEPSGQRRLHQGVPRRLRRDGRPDRPDVGRGLRVRPAPSGGRAEDRQGRQRHDHLDPARGDVRHDRGQPVLGRRRRHQRHLGPAPAVDQSRARPGLPGGGRRDTRRRSPSRPGAGDRCTPSCRRSSSASSPAGCTR